MAQPSPPDHRGPGSEPDALRSADPAILLKFCNLCLQAGKFDRARQLLDASRLSLTDWNSSHLLNLTRIAEKIGAFELAAMALEIALSRDRVPRPLADYILRLSHTSTNARLAENVRNWLSAKVPDDERILFQIESLDLIKGPDAAVERLRSGPVPERNAKEAAAAANLLLQAGCRKLLLRYLSRCRRRWPLGFPFIRLQALALSKFGEPEKALRIVRDNLDTCQGLEATRLQVQILTENGRLEEAQNLVDSAGEAVNSLLIPQQRMQIKLALGEFESAEALVPAVSSAMGRGYRALAQFRVTHLGAMLNEAKLFTKAAQEAGGQQSTQRHPHKLEHAFFFPAKKALDVWLKSRREIQEPVEETDVPRRILQYWDTKEIPADVESTMNSWRHLPGYRYDCFNRRTAIAFLLRRFDPTHVRAFRLANNTAEECDFLRLCLLLAEGGIYADADDKLVGDPDELRAMGRGVILFREPFGAITNHLLIARPGHRLFQLAVDMARESLLARENDNTWSKTGPGLMTRATAVYIDEAGAMDLINHLTILPRYVSQRQVQSHIRLPYKTTPAYWNSKDGALPPELETVITKVAEANASFYPNPKERLG